MSLGLWFFAVGVGLALSVLGAWVWGQIAVDAEIPGFRVGARSDFEDGAQPSPGLPSARTEPTPARRLEGRGKGPDNGNSKGLTVLSPLPGLHGSRPAPARSLPGGPVLPARDRIVGLDDGQLRHAWDWKQRERELRGEV